MKPPVKTLPRRFIAIIAALCLILALFAAFPPKANAAAGDVDIQTAFEGQFKADIIAWALKNSYSTTTLTAAQVNTVDVISVKVLANTPETIKLSDAIDSLKGIELFTGLDVLECSGTNINGRLDVSALKNLTNISCNSTGITELVLTGLTNLVYLYCFDTNITKLNVRGFTNLKTLTCGDTGITELDLTGLSGLESLTCERVGVTKLDLGGLANLKFLICNGANITGKLDLRGLSNLENLSCYGTGITELVGLSGLTGLRILDCSDTDIAELNLDNNTALEILTCTNIPVHSLNLTALGALQPGRVYVGGGRYFPVASQTVNLDSLNGFDVNRVVNGFTNASYDATAKTLTILDPDKPATYSYRTGCRIINDRSGNPDDDIIEFGIKCDAPSNPDPNPNPNPNPRPNPTPPAPKTEEPASGQEPEPDPLIKKADINGDGKVTASDALIVLKVVVSVKNPTAAEIALYDMNGDGRVTPRDALIVLKMSLTN